MKTSCPHCCFLGQVHRLSFGHKVCVVQTNLPIDFLLHAMLRRHRGQTGEIALMEGR